MPENIVLVVDDEPGVIQLCQRLLERAGFQVMTSTKPQDGLEILERERVDLLLVDIRMPGMDGFQVIDLARRHQPALAVVIMTGYGTVEMAIEALQRGADGLILKPFAGVELVQSVKKALQERQHKQDILRLQALRPLFDITETLFTETNPDHLIDLLLDAVCGHLQCTHAGFYERQPSETGLYLKAGRGEQLTDQDVTFIMVGGADGLAPGGETPLCISREGPGDAALQAILVEHELVSLMVAPLATPVSPKKEVSRFLFAAREQGETAFRESDLEMFVILARQAAVALENAYLHAELRAYIRRVEDSQRALIQAEKLATAGRLTASIAHEINNPLQAVQNCLHLAGRKELPVKERQGYLKMAQGELERLMHTVQRMLDFYRPGALDRKQANINDLLKRVLSLLEQQLTERGIQLHTHYSTRLPNVLVVGDQIQQVFLNLILNAMEAMPKGGELFIETSREINEVVVVLRDTGPGIPEKEREHLFEPFVSTKEGGTGLGLAVSYGIIAAHGGSLDLLTGLGRGACFKVTMPVEES